jgi:hypothetical protein
MSEHPSKKRQRTNTIGASVSVPTSHVLTLIDGLPREIVYQALKSAAAAHKDVAELVLSQHARIVATERAKVIDFDHYSKSAWKVINVTYSRLSGSKQYEASFDAASSVQDDIKAIGKAATAHASYGTKKSALETLRKIGKTIALSTGTVGHEVQKQFQWDNSLEKTMLQIAKSMTEEEQAKMLTDEFEEKLVELEGLAEDHCIFEKLKDVRLVLSGEQASSDGNTEEDNDDDDEAEQTDEGTEFCDEHNHHNDYEGEDPCREEGSEDDE